VPDLKWSLTDPGLFERLEAADDAALDTAPERRLRADRPLRSPTKIDSSPSQRLAGTNQNFGALPTCGAKEESREFAAVVF
jgi:hypothetical protein